MTRAIVPPLPLLPADAWRPATPAITNAEGDRSPEKLRAVVAQFRVGTEPRYQPRNGATFCNIFAWDFTAAMGVEVPHWVDLDDQPSKAGVGHELSANAVLDWLRTTGLERGWREVVAVEAELQASNGHPTLAVLHVVPHGHLAVVMPSRPDSPGLRVSQAGKRNFEDEPIGHGFGAFVPHFFSHA